jgi:hypothetical protein
MLPGFVRWLALVLNVLFSPGNGRSGGARPGPSALQGGDQIYRPLMKLGVVAAESTCFPRWTQPYPGRGEFNNTYPFSPVPIRTWTDAVKRAPKLPGPCGRVAVMGMVWVLDPYRQLSGTPCSG